MGSFNDKVKWERNGKSRGGLTARTVLLCHGVCGLSRELRAGEQLKLHRRDRAGEKENVKSTTHLQEKAEFLKS